MRIIGIQLDDTGQKRIGLIDFVAYIAPATVKEIVVSRPACSWFCARCAAPVAAKRPSKVETIECTTSSWMAKTSPIVRS